MLEKENILEIFENLAPENPGSDWELILWKKIARNEKPKSTRNKDILYSAGMVLLIAMNFLVFSSLLYPEKNIDKNEIFESVASEVLISTSSSNY